MNGTDDFVLLLLGFAFVFCAGGLFIQISYVMYLLISILRDIKKTTDTISENVQNTDKIKDNIIESMADITSSFVNKQMDNVELIIAKGVYNIIRKFRSD